MKPIAVGGIATSMVDDFPYSPENAGNMIHGQAPYDLFKNAIDVRRNGYARFYEAPSTIDFINEQCSHYIFSCANFIQFNNHTDAKRQAYLRLIKSLDACKIPLVIFGLGAQAPNAETARRENLPPEAIEFMKFLGEKCEVISVRGEFTARVFREYAGVSNTHVTGCPSFYSKPDAFRELRNYLNGPREGSIAYNSTHLKNMYEKQMIQRAIQEGHFWVEVSNREIHRFATEVHRNPELAVVPDVLEGYLEGVNPSIRRDELVDYFAKKYRLFRDVNPWSQFNSEHVRLSMGTRFHGNMVALLAGRPGLWLTHDSRTAELTKTLHLPSVTTEKAVTMSTTELEQHLDYSDTFNNLHAMFDNFNDYLGNFDLPKVKLNF